MIAFIMQQTLEENQLISACAHMPLSSYISLGVQVVVTADSCLNIL